MVSSRGKSHMQVVLKQFVRFYGVSERSVFISWPQKERHCGTQNALGKDLEKSISGLAGMIGSDGIVGSVTDGSDNTGWEGS